MARLALSVWILWIFSTYFKIIKIFNLDFDDAYQLAAAEKQIFTIISFDGDFDRTESGRKTPADF
jgi:predicted nucleic acid-binding protein